MYSGSYLVLCSPKQGRLLKRAIIKSVFFVTLSMLCLSWFMDNFSYLLLDGPLCFGACSFRMEGYKRSVNERICIFFSSSLPPIKLILYYWRFWWLKSMDIDLLYSQQHIDIKLTRKNYIHLKLNASILIIYICVHIYYSFLKNCRWMKSWKKSYLNIGATLTTCLTSVGSAFLHYTTLTSHTSYLGMGQNFTPTRVDDGVGIKNTYGLSCGQYNRCDYLAGVVSVFARLHLDHSLLLSLGYWPNYIPAGAVDIDGMKYTVVLQKERQEEEILLRKGDF